MVQRAVQPQRKNEGLLKQYSFIAENLMLFNNTQSNLFVLQMFS
jgi:hypothetical protein